MIKLLQQFFLKPTHCFYAVVSLLLFAAYYPSLSGEFLWDDSAIFEHKEKIFAPSTDSIVWAFTHVGAGHYQPLALVSYMSDGLLWGMNPLGFHLSNLLLHILVSVFLYQLIATVQTIFFGSRDQNLHWDSYAGVAVLLFALHPMRVETVAWITERRDLLCGVFYFPAITLFLKDRYLKPAMSTYIATYIASLVLFCLSLFSKAWGITLPMVLLLTTYFFDRHLGFFQTKAFLWQSRKIIGYLVPAIIFMGMAKYAQSNSGAALTLEVHGISDRLLQIGYSISYYLYKSILPITFSPLYSLKGHDFYGWQSLAASVAGYILVVVALLQVRKRLYLAIVFFSYLAILLPVSGVMQSGPQLVADRYGYFATVPFYLLAAIATRYFAVFERFKNIALPIGVALIGLLSVLTFLYTFSWQSELRLWTHAILQDKNNYTAWRNRGYLYLQKGDQMLAAEDFNHALSAAPNDAEAHFNVAMAAAHFKHYQKAIHHFTEAIAFFDNYLNAYINRGRIHAALGDYNQALIDFNKALSINPESQLAKESRAALIDRK